MTKERKCYAFWLLPQILCGLMLSFTVFVFGPIDMWSFNSSDFWFDLEHFALLFVGLFVVCFLLFELIFSLIHRFLPRAIYLVTMAVVFGVSLMLYVQGNWLCMNNQVMLGGTPAWEKMTSLALTNLLIWFAVVVASVMFVATKPKVFMKVVSCVSALVLIMEGASLGVSLISRTASDTPAVGDVYTTVEDAYVASQNGDVLIFMVDTLDTYLMDEVVKSYPEYLKELDGFTYYRNNGGLFSRTDPSFVGMLTGEICKNEEPFFAFANNAFSESDFFPTLQENGFTINVYSAPRGVFGKDMMDVVDNLDLRSSYIADVPEFIETMMYMVGYRYAPIALQPFLFDDFDTAFSFSQGYSDGTLPSAVTDDAKFYEYLKEEGIAIDNSRRFFKFYKMRGCHLPYNVNREGKAVEDGSVTEMDQTLGVFTMIGDYLKMLKEQDMYDSSTIFILADHARHDQEVYQNPTMLVKYPNQTSGGQIYISDAPTSLLDLRASVMYGAGIENYADFGTPLHDWEGVENRERYFYDFKWQFAAGHTFYLDTISEYKIPANATNWKDYKLTGNTYSKGFVSGEE